MEKGQQENETMCSNRYLPASEMPSKNRTAFAPALFLTKAHAIDKIPKVMVYRGMALPGPSHLVKRLAGISKTDVREERRQTSRDNV